MDSVPQSALVGRLATPLFNLFAAILFAVYGLEFDPKTQQVGINLTAAVLSSIPAVWGTFFTPLISKIRQLKEAQRDKTTG